MLRGDAIVDGILAFLRWAVVAFLILFAFVDMVAGLMYLSAAILGLKLTPPHGFLRALGWTNCWLLALYSFAVAALKSLLAYGTWYRNPLGWWLMLILDGIALTIAIWLGLRGQSDGVVATGCVIFVTWWLIARRERAWRGRWWTTLGCWAPMAAFLRWVVAVFSVVLALNGALSAVLDLDAGFHGGRGTAHGLVGHPGGSNPWLGAIYGLILAAWASFLGYGVWRRNALGWWMILLLDALAVAFTAFVGLTHPAGSIGAAIAVAVLTWWLAAQRKRSGISWSRRDNAADGGGSPTSV